MKTLNLFFVGLSLTLTSLLANAETNSCEQAVETALATHVYPSTPDYIHVYDSDIANILYAYLAYENYNETRFDYYSVAVVSGINGCEATEITCVSQWHQPKCYTIDICENDPDPSCGELPPEYRYQEVCPFEAYSTDCK